MRREVTIKDIITMLLAHIKLIIILPIICSLLSFSYTVFLVTPIYSTSMLIYVKNTDAASEEDYSTDNNKLPPNGTSSGTKVNPYDMGTSARIANTCSLLFKTTNFMTKVLEDEKLELNGVYSPGGLKGSVTFESVNESQVMRVSVTSTNAADAAQICGAIFRQSESYYKNYFPTGQIFMVEEAVVPSGPISPNITKNTFYGFVAGLAVAAGIALLIGFIDTTVKTNDDLYKMYNIPVFADIININT